MKVSNTGATTGEYGTLRVNDTALHEGEYIEITVITDATFTTLTGNTDIGTLPQTLISGMSIVGRFTQVQLSAGEILLLRGE